MFFIFRALKVTSWNIRSFFRASVSWNIRSFFRVSVPRNIRTAFFSENISFFGISSGWNFLFFDLGLKSAGFHFQKRKNFFNIRATKFHFLIYQKFFSGWIFLFFAWAWKVRGSVFGNIKKIFFWENIRKGFLWEYMRIF